MRSRFHQSTAFFSSHWSSLHDIATTLMNRADSHAFANPSKSPRWSIEKVPAYSTILSFTTEIDEHPRASGTPWMGPKSGYYNEKLNGYEPCRCIGLFCKLTLNVSAHWLQVLGLRRASLQDPRRRRNSPNVPERSSSHPRRQVSKRGNAIR